MDNVEAGMVKKPDVLEDESGDFTRGCGARMMMGDGVGEGGKRGAM